jgi:hypothetical protein
MPTLAENVVSYYKNVYIDIKCVDVENRKRGLNLRNWFVLKFFLKLFRLSSNNFVPETGY